MNKILTCRSCSVLSLLVLSLGSMLSCATTKPAAKACTDATQKSPAVSDNSNGNNNAGSSTDKAPPVLRLEGTPEIPKALRQRMNQYLNTRSASLQDLRDDGKQVLITTRFGQTSQLHLLDAPMAARRQLTFFAEPAYDARFVPSDATGISYVSDRGGNEMYQIFRLDLNTGRSTRLSDGQSRHESYCWSSDGQHLAFNSNRRNGQDMDIYLSDGQSEKAQLLVQAKGHWYPMHFSRDGKKLLIGEYVSITESRLYVADTTTGKLQQVTPEQPVASYRDAIFSADGRKLYVSSDRGGEFVQLYALDLGKKSWQPLSEDILWNVEALDLSGDGKLLAFSVNADGLSELYLLHTATGQKEKVKAVNNARIGALRFAHKAKQLGMTLLGATSPGDAYLYDIKNKKLNRWTQSELGGLREAQLVAPELIHYSSFDQRKIPAFYYRPKGAGPHPVLLWIHGGPESQARPYFSPLLQYMVSELGIAVLVPNVRGSDGYGKSYLKLDNGFKREDSVKDIGALLDWLAAQKELDAKRVGVFGGSYGGYMVLASLTHYGDRLRAGADIVGISNFVTFLQNTKAYRRDLRRAEYGDERDEKMRAFLQKISPSNQAEKIQSALFVAQGANDPRVPVSESDQIVQAVRAQGHDVWYMVAGDEGHGFRKKNNRDTFYLLSAMFFAKQLEVDKQIP